MAIKMHMRLPTAALLAIVAASPVLAQDKPDDQKATAEPKTLAELARGADFIGLVQVQSLDYERVRGLPSKGFALLRTLIVYRHPGDPWEKPEFIRVHEKGFGDRKCYYPQRWNEGHRYLVFLEQRKQGGLKGIAPYCKLPVLVTDSFHYALRYPVPGVEIRDRSVVQTLSFTDPDAYVDPGDNIPYSRAEAFRQKGYLEPAGEQGLVFTRGIPISDVRHLMSLYAEAGETASD